MSTELRSRPAATLDASSCPTVPRWLPATWVVFVVAALLSLPVLPLAAWGVVIPIAAAALLAVTARAARGLSWLAWRVDQVDLLVVGGLYLAVVSLLSLAFGLFTADRVLGLFLAFAGGLILGVAGPVGYTTLVRHRPLRTLGLGAHNPRPTLALAALFGGVQFTIMFWGYALPAPVDWVPLLVLLVLWPLLTPIGAFFNYLESGDIALPWASILGFADVLGVMAAVIWLAARRERRAGARPRPFTT